MGELDDINSLEQAAEYLKIEPTKLRRLVSQRKIAYLKQGNKITFPRAAIEAYVTANTTQLPEAPPNPWGLTESSLRRVQRGRQ
ncbi:MULTISPECIES: helix-turn-helix domain-containing protein [unclassified Cryobacterium]|uniref:helix-turn-helix domain-containing protein n=1 Tax=unclassified Cryobacterium TaxID=2649013 RepID=UPI00106CA438|nr:MULTISPECIES: helix-turn-helix domain-containing protein [unclassified Cryobacterium]TFC00252.1 DNA-binding protein [Cryobacterium sp. MDB2-A-1]TFC14116.1 DNA-binding protein [Cryobacterium sp. MDB2-A-2]